MAASARRTLGAIHWGEAETTAVVVAWHSIQLLSRVPVGPDPFSDRLHLGDVRCVLGCERDFGHGMVYGAAEGLPRAGVPPTRAGRRRVWVLLAELLLEASLVGRYLGRSTRVRRSISHTPRTVRALYNIITTY